MTEASWPQAAAEIRSLRAQLAEARQELTEQRERYERAMDQQQDAARHPLMHQKHDYEQQLAEARRMIEQVHQESEGDVPTRSAQYVHALKDIMTLREQLAEARREAAHWLVWGKEQQQQLDAARAELAAVKADAERLRSRPMSETPELRAAAERRRRFYRVAEPCMTLAESMKYNESDGEENSCSQREIDQCLLADYAAAQLGGAESGLTCKACSQPMSLDEAVSIDAEIRSLRAQLAEARQEAAHWLVWGKEQQQQLDAARAELAAVKADAERLREVCRLAETWIGSMEAKIMSNTNGGYKVHSELIAALAARPAVETETASSKQGRSVAFQIDIDGAIEDTNA